jgi:hypothetical protein
MAIFTTEFDGDSSLRVALLWLKKNLLNFWLWLLCDVRGENEQISEH